MSKFHSTALCKLTKVALVLWSFYSFKRSILPVLFTVCLTVILGHQAIRSDWVLTEYYRCSMLTATLFSMCAFRSIGVPSGALV